MVNVIGKKVRNGGAWIDFPTSRALRNYVALTDAATVAVDASLGDHVRLLATSGIGATRKLGNPTNSPGAGQDQMLFLEYRQDAAGGRALTFDTKYRFGVDIPSVTVNSGANKTTYVGFRYDATDDMWDVIASSGGF